MNRGIHSVRNRAGWALWAGVVGALLPCASALGQCEDGWLPGTAESWMSSDPVTMTTWDPDGDGPLAAQLIIGGDFTTVAGEAVNRIARWDGAAWRSFGPGLDGLVRSIASWDIDGPGGGAPVLVAAGDFLHSGGTSVNRVAWWDGSAWQPLGGGVDGPARALTSWDPDGPGPAGSLLIAGGEFLNAGAVAAARIAAWDGSAWSALDAGVSGGSQPSVNDLTTWDPDGPGPLNEVLCAGGRFTSAGGGTANQVAIWDGARWEALLSGLIPAPYGYVNALVSWDPDGAGPSNSWLVWGGAIGVAGGGSNEYIGAWDGIRWTGLQAPLGSAVEDLAVADLDGPGPLAEQIIAVGQFPVSGRSSAVVRWTGAEWADVDSRSASRARAAGVLDPDGNGPRAPLLVVAGPFYGLGSSPVRQLARWEESGWQGFGSGSSVSQPFSALWIADPDADGPLSEQVIAGRPFSQYDGGLARWDGVAWRAFAPSLGGGASLVESLTDWDPDGAGPARALLIVGGRFTTAGSLAANQIAAWDGTGWLALGAGLQGSQPAVAALTTWDPDGDGPLERLLIAGGNFDTAGGVPAKDIAAWNGSAWSPIGGGVTGHIDRLATWDFDGEGPEPERLIAAGFFTVVGSSPLIAHLAAWDGQVWSGLGGPVENLYDFEGFDPDGDGPAPMELYAIGGPSSWGYVLRWSGTSWVVIGSMNRRGVELAVWDPDGPGPVNARLVAGGSFTTMDGRPMNRVAQWDGVEWMPIGEGIAGGTSAEVAVIAAWDVDGPGPHGVHLLVGGEFTRAGDQVAASFAHWGSSGPWFAGQPKGREASAGDLVSFSVTPGAGLESGAPASFRWRRNGEPIFDGPTPGGAVISGAATPTLFLMDVGPGDGAGYDCVMTTPCGESVSQEAELVVAGCAADLAMDGVVDFADYLEFLNLFDALDPRVDFNGDGVVDFGDYLEFLNHYDAGC